LRLLLIFSSTTLPSTPAFLAIWRTGSCSALTMIFTPVFSSPSTLPMSFSTAGTALT